MFLKNLLGFCTSAGTASYHLPDWYSSDFSVTVSKKGFLVKRAQSQTHLLFF